jgi:hypothetical protein
MLRVTIFIALAAAVAAAGAGPCSTVINGKTYDFSPLISGEGAYRFSEPNFVSVAGEAGLPGNLATTMAALKPETKVFEVLRPAVSSATTSAHSRL